MRLSALQVSKCEVHGFEFLILQIPWVSDRADNSHFYQLFIRHAPLSQW